MEHILMPAETGNGPVGPDPCRLAVVTQAIDALSLDPKNPRLHSRRQVRQIARSITAFGFNVPILVDADLKVIAGHGRVLACLELGWSEVPTICLEHLNEAQRRAFMVADNRLTETSVWDDRLLAEQLRELSLLDLDFSLEATGFEIAEIDLRIERLGPHSDGENDPADVVPPVSSAPPIAQAGDLWLLGRHRVICGSALDPTSYSILMDEEHASVVFTDPPYNVPIEGHVSGLGSVTHREFAMASGEMDEAQFIEFLTSTCSLAAHHAMMGRSISSAWTGATWASCSQPAKGPIASSRTSACGSSTMPAWARSIAASMNSSSCSSMAATRIVTTSNWVASDGIGAMCGTMLVPIPLGGERMRAICSTFIRP
jgi:hypothetical protein